MFLIFFFAGLVLLYFGSEWLVESSHNLALALGVKPFLISITIVAFGTSLPELLVSIQAGWLGVGDLALGNVVGSNICNVLLIIGTAALFQKISISRRLLFFDMPVMLGVSILLIFLLSDGVVTLLNGILFLSVLLLFLIVSAIRGYRQHHHYEMVPQVVQENKSVWKRSAVLIAGLLLLLVGAWLFVDGAIGLARFLGVNEAVIGLTVVAFGTSVPELASSVVAARKGHADFIMGNIIGSNIYNILLILGVTSLIVPLEMGNISFFDLFFMAGSSFLILPFAIGNWKIGKIIGILFLALYTGYIIYLM